MKKLLAILRTIPMVFAVPTGVSSASFIPEERITKAEAAILCERALCSAQKAGAYLPDVGITLSKDNT